MKRATFFVALALGLLAAAPALADGTCNARLKRSPASSEAAQLTVINTGTAPLFLDWLDFKGQHKNYATIEPGASYVQQTFVGHVWMLSTTVGNCVKLFKTRRGASTVRVALTDEDEKGGD